MIASFTATRVYHAQWVLAWSVPEQSSNAAVSIGLVHLITQVAVCILAAAADVSA